MGAPAAAAAAAAVADGESAAWCESHARPRLSVAPMMAWTTPHFRVLLRMLTKRTLLFTEMVPVAAVLAAAERSPARLQALLGVEPGQRPLAVQLGGRDPAPMADAARHCAALGCVDEININVGCPSDTVSVCHCYGAALMKEATRVQQLAAAVRSSVPQSTAVTIKHRLGVDDCDSWGQLLEFVRLVSAPPASVRHFIVHARKAILGLSTSGNREVPPLRHDWVVRLSQEFPQLSFELNGGVANIDQAAELLAIPQHDNGVDTGQRCQPAAPALRSVMIGRAAFHSPWMLATVDADSRIFSDDAAAISHPAAAGVAKPLTRRQIVMQYVEYAEGAWDRGRLQLEEDVRQEMCAEGIAAHSSHTVAHRLKPRLCALREALYLPIMNLFAAPQLHGATAERPRATTAAIAATGDGSLDGDGNDHEGGDESTQVAASEVAAADEWRKRLEKSLAKRAGLRKAAAYALRAVDDMADVLPVHERR